MGRLRYAQSVRDLERARDRAIDEEGQPAFVPMRALRCVYETDAEAVQAIVPRPLEVARDPQVHVSIAMLREARVANGPPPEVASAVLAVRVAYDGVEGLYPIMMPTSSEQLLVQGRERFGEPRKLARVELFEQDGHVRASVERAGIRLLRIEGTSGTTQAPFEEEEVAWCFKVFPGCRPSRGFDQDPQLVRLDWLHRHDRVRPVSGTISLEESALDPVADLPIRRLVRLEVVEGKTSARGRVLRPVPGDWLIPFLHQRYDSPDVEGLDV